MKNPALSKLAAQVAKQWMPVLKGIAWVAVKQELQHGGHAGRA